MESVCPSRCSLQSVLPGVSLRSLQYVEPDDLTKGDIGAMLQILQAAAKATERQDTTEWNRHVLYRSAWRSGWKLLITKFFGIMVEKASGLGLPPHGELASKKVCDKMRAAHAAGLALHKSAVPRTMGEYAAMVEPLKTLLSKWHPPSLSPGQDYSILWCIRSHCFAEMRARGINKCHVPADMSINSFSQCFPDAGKWLTQLAKEYDFKFVHELLD